MARRPRRKPVSKNRGTMHGKWLQNAVKGFGAAYANVLKDIAPNTTELVTSTANVARDMAVSINRNRAGVNRISTSLSNNKFVKLANKAYNNALNDLKAGNIHGDDSRMMDAAGFGDFMNDSGFSFGDDGAGSVNVNYIAGGGDNSALLNTVSSEIKGAATAQVKMQKASMDAYVAVSAANMAQIGDIGAQIMDQLDSANASLSSMVQFQNENLNQFMETAMAYFERTGAHMSGEDEKSKAKNDVMLGGKFNLGSYKKLVKKQFQDAFKNTSFGQISQWIMDDDVLEMAAANPLGFLSEGMVRMIVPTAMTNSIELVEKAFNNMMPEMMNRMAKLGQKEGGTFADGLLRMIGQTFGVDLSDKKSSMNAKINTGAIPFDGETKTAITQVITKELRDQSGYLRAIAEKVAGKNAVKAAQAQSSYFDFESGRYIKQADVNKKIADHLTESIRMAFTGTDFGNAMDQFVSSRNGETLQKEASKLIDDFYLQIERSGNEDIDIEMLLRMVNATGATPGAKKALRKALTKLNGVNKGAIRNAYAGRYAAHHNLQDAMEEIEKNYGTNNFISSAFNSDRDPVEVLKEIQEYNKRYGTQQRWRSSSGRAGVDYEADTLSVQNPKTAAFLEKITAKANTSMQALIHGDIKGAMDAIKGGIGDTVLNLAKSLRDKVFGNQTVHDKTDSLLKSFTDIGNNVKVGIYTTLFGAKRGIEVSNLTDDQKADARKMITDQGLDDSGIVGKFKGFISKGLSEWNKTLFGDDEEGEKLKKDLAKQAKDSLGSTLAGAGIGVGLNALAGSSILGALIGGPIGGAVLGAAGGFIAHNKRFQKWLFGEDIDPDDPSKGKVGGVISRATQQFFKEHKDSIGTGIALGTVGGAITGGGLLGTIVGGPIAGAALGLAGGILKERGTFHTFLFGDEEHGQKSVFQGMADAFKRHAGMKLNGSTLSDEETAMGATGAGIGAISAAVLAKAGILGAALGPAGPIGGAVLGFASGIAMQGKSLREYLWGKKDGLDLGNGKKRDAAGIFGRIGNAVQANFITPLTANMANLLDDMHTTIKYDILAPVAFLGESVAGKVGDIVGSLGEGALDLVGAISGPIKDGLAAAFPKITSALSDGISGMFGLAWKGFKSVATIPAKVMATALSRPVQLLRNKIIDPMGNIIKAGLHGFAGIVKGGLSTFGKVLALPFKAIGAGRDLIVRGARLAGSKLSNTKAGQFIGDKYRNFRDAYDRMWGNIESSYDDAEDGFLHRWRQSRLERRDALEANRRIARDRKNSARNAKIINKLTGGQFGSDSPEARAYLENIYRNQYIQKHGLSDEDLDDESVVKKIQTHVENQFATAGIKGKKAGMQVSIVGKSDSEVRRTPGRLLDNASRTVKGVLDIITILRGKDPQANAAHGNSDADVDDSEDNTNHPIMSLFMRNRNHNNAENEDDASGGGNGPGRKRGGRGIITSLISTLVGGASSLLSGLFGGNKNEGGSSQKKRRPSVFNRAKNAVASTGGLHNPEDPGLDESSIGDDSRSKGAADSGGVEANRKRESINAKRISAARLAGKTAAELKEEKSAGKNGVTMSDMVSDMKEDIHKSFNLKDGILPMALIGGMSLLHKLPDLIGNLGGILSNGFEVVKGLFNGLSSIVGSIWNSVSGIAAGIGEFLGDAFKNANEQREYTNKNAALDNGQTVQESSAQFSDEIRNKDYLTDAEGDLQGRTGSLVRAQNKAIKSAAVSGYKRYNKIAARKAATKAAKEVIENAGAKSGKKAAKKAAMDAAKKKGVKLSSRAAKKVVKEATEAVAKKSTVQIAENTADSVAKKTAMKYISEFFKMILDKVGASASKKVASNALGEASESAFTKLVTKYWTKMSSKITAAISAKTAAFVASGGLINLAFIGIAAVHGMASKAACARLFYVNQSDVDGTMRLVSGIFQALDAASIIVTIVDIAMGVIADITGVDWLCSIATAIYNVLNAANAEKLQQAQNSFKTKWAAEKRDPKLSPIYNELISSGKLESSVTYAEFVEKKLWKQFGYDPDYQGLVEYNANKNATLGERIVTAVESNNKKSKKAYNALEKKVGTEATKRVYNSTNLGYNPNTNAAFSGPSNMATNIPAFAPPGKKGSKGGFGIGRRGGFGNKLTKSAGTGKNGISATSSSIKWNVKIDPDDPEGTTLRQLGGIGELLATSVALQTQGVRIALQEYSTLSHMSMGSNSYSIASSPSMTSQVSNISSGSSNVYASPRTTKPTLGSILGSIASRISGGIRNLITGGRGTLNGGTYFSQNDPAFKNAAYGFDGATMGDSGCGPTAMAMAASDALGGNISPMSMASLAQITGNRDETGTNWDFIDDASAAMGLNTQSALNPSAQYINSQLDSGNPVILSGTKGGYGGRGSSGGAKGGDPYTKEGHYVVAVGKDSQGNVIVNDPRGKQYSGKYSLGDIAKGTHAAWTIGGYGPKDKADKDKTKKKKSKKDKKSTIAAAVATAGNDYQKWIGCIKAVKQAIATQFGYYSQKTSKDIEIAGKKIKVRPDCTGFISACMQLYGAVGYGSMSYSGSMKNATSSFMTKAGFTSRPFTSWSDCKMGDVVVRSGHGEIFESVNPSGGANVWNVGSDTSAANPGTSTDTGTYTIVWSPGPAGADCPSNIADLSASGSIMSNTDASVAGGAVAESETGFSGLLSYLGSAFSTLGSRYMSGDMKNTDYSKETIMGTTQAATGDTGTGDFTASGATGGGSLEANAAVLAKALKANGFNNNQIGGILSNFNAEGGIDATSVETIYDEKFTLGPRKQAASADFNAFTLNKVFPAYAGKVNLHKDAYKAGNVYVPGIGIGQWTGPRGKLLLDYAKSQGKNWYDIGTQADFMLTADSFKDRLMGYKNATVNYTPKQAAKYFENKWEGSRYKEAEHQATADSWASKVDSMTGGYGNGRRRPTIMNNRMYGGYGSAKNKSTGSVKVGSNAIKGVVTGAISPVSSKSTNTNNRDVVTLLSQVVNLLSAISNSTYDSSVKLELLRGLSTGNNTVIMGSNGQAISSNSGQSNRKGKSKADFTAQQIAYGV